MKHYFSWLGLFAVRPLRAWFIAMVPLVTHFSRAHRRPHRRAVGMPIWRLVATLFATVVAAGCAHAPDQEQPLAPSELTELVTDRTLYVPACCGTPYGTVLYLARGGTGWLDSRVRPGYPPNPNGMSIVFDWRVMEGSQICLWATPRIGDMPSFLPAFAECLLVYRHRGAPDGLKVTVTQGSDRRTGWLYLYSFNVFPQPVINQYLSQVRVLYGGHIPVWTPCFTQVCPLPRS